MSKKTMPEITTGWLNFEKCPNCKNELNIRSTYEMLWWADEHRLGAHYQQLTCPICGKVLVEDRTIADLFAVQEGISLGEEFYNDN